MAHNASHKLHCNAIEELHLIPVCSWTLTFSSRRLNPVKRPWLHSQITPAHLKWICSHSLLLPLHLYNGNSRFYRAKGQAHTAQAIQNFLCTGFWRVISWLIFLHVKVKHCMFLTAHSGRERVFTLAEWNSLIGQSEMVQRTTQKREGKHRQTYTYTEMGFGSSTQTLNQWL